MSSTTSGDNPENTVCTSSLTLITTQRDVTAPSVTTDRETEPKERQSRFLDRPLYRCTVESCFEHTFRLLKQTLGWTCPKIRDPRAADRWTWLILAVYTQLRLARPLAADLRRPWEEPASPQRLSPARVRRGFRHLRAKTLSPAQAPKPSRPGPGRPPGRRNNQPAPRHDVYTATGLTTTKTPARKPTTKKSANPRPRRTGSGGPGESHPWAPTEPCVTVARYTALLILSRGSCSPKPSA